MDFRLKHEKALEDEFYDNMQQLDKLSNEGRYDALFHRNLKIVAGVLFKLQNNIRELGLYILIILLLLLFK